MTDGVITETFGVSRTHNFAVRQIIIYNLPVRATIIDNYKRRDPRRIMNYDSLREIMSASRIKERGGGRRPLLILFCSPLRKLFFRYIHLRNKPVIAYIVLLRAYSAVLF